MVFFRWLVKLDLPPKSDIRCGKMEMEFAFSRNTFSTLITRALFKTYKKKFICIDLAHSRELLCLVTEILGSFSSTLQYTKRKNAAEKSCFIICIALWLTILIFHQSLIRVFVIESFCQSETGDHDKQITNCILGNWYFFPPRMIRVVGCPKPWILLKWIIL